MFRNIGSTELIIIAVVLLFLFGGKKLPELGRGIGDAIKEFRKAFSGKEENKK
ncbi:preprotein translocase [Candidatus Shapirobacteria bacterium RIFOXYD1_FULL_38_32]|uniref:Sec-independent protein translocase protein TatA n=2 Tax=Candidatus Shapironibacteriota TaxID=1752721 RepID=A0A0G0JLB4_9BACT|nr:MAG: Sec-independent protein translocase protein TatA [Candidatus Shapirobacteria bacterium GW2011_GWE2_38_30]KKQ89794.1 MAG: Sec-independent protein translocase protein TatA [Candidatus Shapirobacteria bacterium GW2011_GWE1_38_92]OGL56645.1 MAG: preprotein translocase [Candidatus Shapirobacteria bacterium RIFOXYA1_FULL_39_17]OGL57071.1 MAG: preprotein translocase [Candidatus Shapirobacteria bacterium RIFOXYC1_FULL_38_24]OGL57736.1 MAG: preprotein translocase [Candidatus Shapirobacteria bact